MKSSPVPHWRTYKKDSKRQNTVVWETFILKKTGTPRSPWHDPLDEPAHMELDATIHAPLCKEQSNYHPGMGRKTDRPANIIHDDHQIQGITRYPP